MEKSLYNFLKKERIILKFKYNLVHSPAPTHFYTNDKFKSIRTISEKDINDLKIRAGKYAGTNIFNIYYSIYFAFAWELTPEDNDYWADVDNKYKKYLEPIC